MALRSARTLFLLTVLPHAARPYDGEPYSVSEITASSQQRLPDYQLKKKVEAVGVLKGELGEHPDLTGQTQREGTLREHVILKPISKDKYWARTGPIGFDNNIVPGLAYAEADTFYEPVPAEDYAVNLLVNPCRGRRHDCCQDVFGAPVYANANRSRVAGTVSALGVVDGKGSTLPVSQSRLQDQFVHFDASCSEVVAAGGAAELRGAVAVQRAYDGFGQDVYTQCVGHNLAMDLQLDTPACWDHNTTVNATLPCATVRGDVFPSCLAVAYFSSAYVVQCGGPYREDNHCGTFVELHEAQSAPSGHGGGGPGGETSKVACGEQCNAAVLSQVRLEGGFGNGYRTATLPLTVRGNATQVICEGRYELWWVQRTLWGFVTQLKKNFTAVAPACDFDPTYDRQKMYSSAALPAFQAPARFVPGH